MVLKSAFNMLTKLHSRPATLKRWLNNDDSISTPIRITPSNYFRYLASLSSTVVHGREFIIPLDSMLGFPIEEFLIENATDGDYKLTNNSGTTGVLAWNSSAGDLQTAIREIDGHEDVEVTGSLASGYMILFKNVEEADLFEITANNLIGDDEPGISSTWSGYQAWATHVKRGDKILDGQVLMAIDEIIEIPDLGGSIMGYRVRCE